MSNKQIALISIFHNIHNSLSTFTLLLGCSPNPRWCRHLGSEILFVLHYRGLPFFFFFLIIQLRELEFYYHTHFSHLLTLSNGSLVNQNTCGITQCWCSWEVVFNPDIWIFLEQFQCSVTNDWEQREGYGKNLELSRKFLNG